MNKQLSIFDIQEVIHNEVKTSNVKKIVINNLIQREDKELSTIKDVRTEGQRKNLVSFDVGEKIGGSRKDLAQTRDDFLNKPSLKLLKDLENEDVATAAEIIKRETFFSWFSLEDCKKRGVQAPVAKAIQLFIKRIPKESYDTVEDRKKYTKTMMFLSDLLMSVKTKEQFSQFESRVFEMLLASSGTDAIERRIISYRESIANTNNETTIKRYKDGLEELRVKLFLCDMAAEMSLEDYDGPFLNYFMKRQSRATLIRNAYEITCWNDLLKSEEENSKDITSTKSVANRKPVWERVLPETPSRDGGREISMINPKQFVKHFGFRASEFGHYVGDKKGQEHLQNSAEAYIDLAEILDIPIKAVSLKEELAMAFGARGRGKALGHYEPGKKVINLTKKKGSLGILAHEWFHAFDHFLYNTSHAFQNGRAGYISELDAGSHVSNELIEASRALMDVIKNGTSIAYINVDDCLKTYRVSSSFKELYKIYGNNHKAFMDSMIQSFDDRMERHLSGFLNKQALEKMKKKYAKKRAITLRNNAEALAEYHYKQTGEKVKRIPYTDNRTMYYQAAIGLDKNKVGKYWSSNCELAARAFESFIYEELKMRGWISDYLVCGIRDAVFPQDEEKEKIFNAMRRFVEAAREYLL